MYNVIVPFDKEREEVELKRILDKPRLFHGLHPPKQVVRYDRMKQIADKLAVLPEHNSVEMLYELAQANLITFWEMYLLLGRAIRQPDMLEERCSRHLEQL